MESVSYIDHGINLVLSLVVGLAFGIERQHSTRDKANRSYGLRDFMIIAMLGYLASLVHSTSTVSNAWLLTFALVIVYSMISFVLENTARLPEQRPGGLTSTMTSTMAMPFTFLTASLPNFGIQPWILATVMFLVLLIMNLKAWINTFGSTIEHREISDFAVLIAVAISITPLIPAQAVIPIPLLTWVDGVRQIHYNNLSLAMLWKVVYMVSLMSFIAHFVTKYVRGRKALVLATYFAGLVSALATNVLLHDKAKMDPKAVDYLSARERYVGYCSSNCGAFTRNMIVFRLVIGPELFSQYFFIMFTCLLAFAGLGVYAFKGLPPITGADDQEVRITKRPVPLGFVMKFAGLFACLILVIGAVNFYLGAGATVFATFVASNGNSGAALGALGTSMLQDPSLNGWIAGLSIVAALSGSITSQFVIIAGRIGMGQSIQYLLTILAQWAVGLTCVWIAFA